MEAPACGQPTSETCGVDDSSCITFTGAAALTAAAAGCMGVDAATGASALPAAATRTTTGTTGPASADTAPLEPAGTTMAALDTTLFTDASTGGCTRAPNGFAAYPCGTASGTALGAAGGTDANPSIAAGVTPLLEPFTAAPGSWATTAQAGRQHDVVQEPAHRPTAAWQG